MNKRLLCLLLGIIAICASCSQQKFPGKVTDATTGDDPQYSLAQGVLREIGATGKQDIERGARIVLGRDGCKPSYTCFSCFQCHGIRGEGAALATVPRVAGQSANYLRASLQRFASGERQNATMHEVASALTPQQITAVAAYYAAIPTAILPPVAIQTVQQMSANAGPTVQFGEQIARQGISSAAVPACVTCHGITRSAGALYPDLAGQVPAYLEQQLAAFRDGTRRGADAAIMQTIAKNLTPEQSNAVSTYYSSLKPDTAASLPGNPLPASHSDQTTSTTEQRRQ